MSRRFVAAVMICAPLVSVLGLFGLAVALRLTVDRRAERREAEAVRLRAEAESAREFGRTEVVAAFTDPVPPEPEEVAGFAELFTALGKALEKGDGATLARKFAPERLFDELLHVGQFNKLGVRLGPDNREEFVREMREVTARNGFNPTLRWHSTDVRRVRWSADRTEAVVIASHVNETESLGRVKIKMRWWLTRGPDGWRVYDFEDLDQGLRFTHLMGSILTPDLMRRVPELRPAFLAIRSAQAALMELDFDKAEAALAGCRSDVLPDPIAATVHTLRAAIHISRGEPKEALEGVDRAAQLQPDFPLTHLLRAQCHLLSGEHIKVLTAVDAYTALLGPDDEAEALRGTALEGLNRTDEARAAYRRAGDLDPDAPAPLLGLCRLFDPNHAQEIGDRLGRAADPRKLYDALRRETAGAQNAAADDALLDGLRRARPDDLYGLSEDLRRQVTAGKFDAALKLLEHGLRMPPPAQTQVLNSYLYAMCGAKKWQSAYAAVAATHAGHAFRTLAEDLDDTVFDREDEELDATVEELRRLTAAHRKRAPADPWLWYYEGAAFQHERDYEKAAVTFAAGAERLPTPKAGNDPDDPDPEVAAVDQFRWRRVECLFQARRGLEAYEKVGPVSDVFQQLAGSYDRAGDFDGLNALLAAHRKREPKDVQHLYWEGHLKFQDRDYPGAAALFKKFLAASGDKTANVWVARNEYLRAVLRARPADAPALLAELEPERVPRSLRAAVAATAGDRAELERLVAEATENGRPLWFYSDKDFCGAIRHERWAELRAKHPDPNPRPKEGM